MPLRHVGGALADIGFPRSAIKCAEEALRVAEERRVLAEDGDRSNGDERGGAPLVRCWLESLFVTTCCAHAVISIRLRLWGRS